MQREVARRRREEEAQAERKNPIQQYIDLLQSQDEAAWKDTLIGMGQGPEIPKLFRLSGKVSRRPRARRRSAPLPWHSHTVSWLVVIHACLAPQVRNKHIAKRDTEKMVKEIWKERLNDPGEAADLLDLCSVATSPSTPSTRWKSSWLTACCLPACSCVRRQGGGPGGVCVHLHAEESWHHGGGGGGAAGACPDRS